MTFEINGQEHTLDIPADITALEVIRSLLGLTGTKEGCGIGECGACTIVVDGKSVNSCLMLGAQLDGTKVLTVEGLATEASLAPLQEQFMKNHGVQCGFCTPGILMSTHALLEENPDPDTEEISKALAGNLCRCTGYQQIFASVKAAATASRDDRITGGKNG
ncbi:2Fe-2S iron-sulfur cluster-binding protein [Desulfobacula sp.]|uniref:(2Fe-2S)-binding protein n=1 Tax=Desulfobacula sp. TaxID=2593537 RepID=UPI002606E858|nr:2Fe-2S iron-sulfur cluster-binding protein [Desulfobacula sp.]